MNLVVQRSGVLRPFLTPTPWAPLRLISFALLMLGLGGAACAQTNGIYREVYTGITGGTVANLTNNAKFPNSPNSTEILTNSFEPPRDAADNYGQRLRALIVPPLTGTYVFWISSDDASTLYLSSDESAFNKVQIAWTTSAISYRQWNVQASQQSTNLWLETGRRYYIEALHKEGTSSDFVSVRWRLPGGTIEEPIPASRMRPYGLAATTAPIFTSQPVSITVLENAPAVFRVGVSNLDVVSYQWQRNGVNLGGANGATYTLAQATTNDNGASFRCLLTNALGTNLSSNAVLTVTPDTTPPELFGAANLNSNTVQVTFTEPVEPASATNLSNYSLIPSTTITGATFGSSTRVINLATSPLNWGTIYTLTVSNVRDRAAARNTITPESQAPFPALLKGIYREVFTNLPGSTLADLTNSPVFPNSPSSALLMTNLCETTNSGMNNYGQRLRAQVIPPVSGYYAFCIAAADTAVLSLGTDETPASARPICSVLSALMLRQWDGQVNQCSPYQPLIAGRPYYLEVVMKDGISDDHVTVRWRMPDGSYEEPIPAARLTPYGMNPPLIATQPAGITVVEGSSATFQVTVGNVDPISFQWQQNGTNIPGATNALYTDSLVQLAEDGSALRCVLWNPMRATNTAPALLRVTPDLTPPTLSNVLNNGTTNVVVFFSEPVEPASATNAINYRLNDGSVSAATLWSDGRTVTLTTTPLTLGNTYTLTVNGVRDSAFTPNSISTDSQFTFLAAAFFPRDIGAPPLPGTITFAGNGVDVMASGRDIGGSSDQFNFSCQPRLGDFDVQVRVQRLDLADTWTAAGLMAREDLTAGSRHASVFSTPSIAGTFFQYRTNSGGSAQMSGTFPVNYPNTWLRLKRVGNQFTGYASFEGQTWTQLGTVSNALPATVYLGYAVASHSAAQTAVAQFRDYADSVGGTVGALPVAIEPPGPSSRRTGLAFTEIMYHPAPRADGRQLEFIELFNSNPFPEDLGGCRISGDVDYTFPSGTVLPGGGYVVVARNPADVQAEYGITNVAGPYTNSLPNSVGLIRLRNPADAILLEVNYDSKAPWPVAADGTGHSLVLARPSYGEDNPQAWGQSDVIGGSPGTADGVRFEAVRNVMINEFLAHTELPEEDFIELYNHSMALVDVSGCWLSDDPATNKFRIPDGTVLGPTGFVYFTETTLGFGLNSGGEAIYLVNSNRTRVIDSVRFAGQELGVSVGRYPDGAPDSALRTPHSALRTPTPGAPNAPLRIHDIVINEIMYHPVTDDDNDEYVELYNRGTNAISLDGWRFMDGIDFTFPTNAVIPPDGYIVVARNAAHLMTNYPTLNTNNTFGDFDGTLKNSGERIALSMRDYRVTTNSHGLLETNAVYIVVDEVTYGTGGRWGAWSDGGGSSLELIDPRSDNRLASNWGDSDDTAKSLWTTVSTTGTLDNSAGHTTNWNSLQIGMLDPGECLVDNVVVSIGGGANLVPNPDFEWGLANWYFQGDHRNSYLEESGYASSRSLHVVASGRGDTGANRIRTTLTGTYTNNVTGTIAAKVKWLHGRPEILFRLRGNHLEAPATLLVPSDLGTPGVRNSRYASNAPPAISEVVHQPILPAANQAVVVTAKVHDPDGIASVQLVYRLDPTGAPVTVPMVDDGTGVDTVAGDGVYAATIPGQTNNALVAFYLEATDAYTPPATARFPNDAPVRECLVRFGDAQPMFTYGTYRFWLTQSNFNQWVSDENLSNEPNEGTFVYGNYRAIYNAAARYAGSPFHAPNYNSPTGNNCDYQLNVPADDAFLGATEFRLQMPGNGGGDATLQGEQTAYWMAAQLGEPYLYRRSVCMFLNGVRRGKTYEDTQQPNADYDKEWWPDNPSDLYKVMHWFEFDDAGSYRDATTSASLALYTTTGGQKKLARYRQNFGKRAVQDSASNYTNLFNLVDTVNTAATGEVYVAQVFPVVDITEWTHAFAVERLLNNTDLYANGGGQNCFIVKPEGHPWKFLIWDIDFAFGGQPTNELFKFTDTPITTMFNQPQVRRIYWQALEDAANGPLLPARAYPGIDARYAAFQASGISASSPASIKNFIAVRREHILTLLAGVRADFAITSNGGNDFTNASTIATLTGTAPISVRVITINGLAYPIAWTSLTNWLVRLPLTGRTNNFVIQGYDAAGRASVPASLNLTLYFNGPVSRPEDSLLISEILFNPAVSNTSFVEIFNRSTNTTFDLMDYRLQGIDFDFAPGTYIEPGGFLVVVKDFAAFQELYGTNVPIAGQFNGNLDPEGETLTLLKKETPSEPAVIIDQVKYEAVAPWPSGAATPGSGASLQLIDPAQDNARVSNWSDGLAWRFVSFTGVPRGTRLRLYLDTAGEVYIDDLQLVPGTVAGVGTNLIRNGDFEAPLAGTWSFQSTQAVNSTSSTDDAHSGSSSLHLIFTSPGGTLGYMYQEIASLSTTNTNTFTLSFSYRPSTNAANLTLYLSSGFRPVFDVRAVLATPGASNSVAGNVAPYPLLWLNEVQPNNPEGLPDNTGTPQPWLELFNSGTNTLSLDGFFLAANYTNLNQWAFPTGTLIGPGEFRVIFTDGQPQFSTGTVLHTSFRLDPTNGAVALSHGQQLLDYINYTNMQAGFSLGSYPNGQLFDRRLFYYVTPATSNNPAPVPVAINEWMAGNTSTLLNPATQRYDDWFELDNFGPTTIDLSGYYLTDNLDDRNKWRIPSGTTIDGHSFLLVWADNDGTGTNTLGDALHTSFQLSKKGDEIGLFSPGGLQVDAVVFGAQTSDVSQGRFPDGNVGGVYHFMPTPTPRAANVLTNNLFAPVLTALPDITVDEGTLLTFTAQAADDDLPAQILTYSLVAGAPYGASIQPLTGVFAWVPLEAQGGASYSMTIKVTDNGSPPREDSRSFNVMVNKVNSAPRLLPVADQAIYAGTTLLLSLMATDSDLPVNHLTYGLTNAPPGVTINPDSALLSCESSALLVGSTNWITVMVTDDGAPPLSDQTMFRVMVWAPPQVQSITLSGTNAVITWSAIPGKTYRLQYTSALDPTGWTDLPESVMAQSEILFRAVALQPARQRFYRIVALP